METDRNEGEAIGDKANRLLIPSAVFFREIPHPWNDPISFLSKPD